MKKILLAATALFVLCSVANACGPLVFCAEGKALRKECSQTFVVDELDIIDLQLMAKACQGIGMPMKITTEKTCEYFEHHGGTPSSCFKKEKPVNKFGEMLGNLPKDR